MKILHISDTHGLHRRIKALRQATMLIHSGDVSNFGEDHEVEDFMRWFCKLDFQYKIFIAGNHDFYFEDETTQRIQRALSENTFYLCDSGIEIEGIYFWGSPVSPTFFNWAFNRDRGAKIRKHWNLIPDNTDVLITHTPPHGILDRTATENTGCRDLLKTVKHIKPSYHLFGHIHEAYGQTTIDRTTFINSSILDENDNLTRNGTLIDMV